MALDPPAGVLGHVGRDPTIPHRRHAVPCVVALVPTQGPGMKSPLPGLVQQHGHHFSLRHARGLGHVQVRQQPVSVFHLGMGQDGRIRNLHSIRGKV